MKNKRRKKKQKRQLRLLLVLLLVSYPVAVQMASAQATHQHEHLVQDPVCGMKVDIHETRFKADYLGKTYYFCSEKCLKDFEKQPDNYVQDQIALAQREYEKNPESIEAGLKLGNALIEANRLDEARRIFSTLLQKSVKDKEKAEINFKLAYISTKEKKYDRALDEYRIVLERFPGTEQYSGATVNTAAIRYQIKDEIDPAFQLLSSALQSGAIVDKHLPTAYKLMFMMNYDLGNYIQARNFLEKMTPEAREDEHIKDSIWVVYLKAGDEKKGNDLLAEYYQQIKDDYFGLYRLASIALEARVHLSEALSWIERANSLSGGNKFYILDTYSKLLWETGKQSEAIEQLEKAISLCRNESALPELKQRLELYKNKAKLKKGGKP